MGHITRKDTAYTDLKSDLVRFCPISSACAPDENWQALPELTLDDGSHLDLFVVSELSEVKHNPLSGPVLTRAIKKFATVDAKSRTLRVYGLFLDDEMIAGLIAFVEARTFSLFTMSYGPEIFPNCSAGTILLVKILELASRARFRTYDFFAGDEPYKLAWCDQRLGLNDCVFAGTSIGVER